MKIIVKKGLPRSRVQNLLKPVKRKDIQHGGIVQNKTLPPCALRENLGIEMRRNIDMRGGKKDK